MPQLNAPSAFFKQHAAASLMILSALGFALMAACVKLVGNLGIPVLEIVAARAFVSLLLSYSTVKSKGISLWGRNKPLLAARGAVGALALMGVYYSITTLPIAEATIIQYLHPVFTAFLAFIFLKERVHFSTIACILLSLAGLVVVINPAIFTSFFTTASTNTVAQGLQAIDDTRPPFQSIAAGLLGAFGSSVAYVIIRRLSQSEDPAVIIFYFPLIALPVSLILLGNHFVIPTLEAAILLLFVGLFTQVGQVSLTKAIKIEKAGKVTAYSYIQVVFAAMLGWIVFAEIPSFYTIVGGGLIIAGALINVLWKK